MPIIKKETNDKVELTSYELAAQAAVDKKAWDVTILNMEGTSLLADYFVLCTVRNERMARSVADEIEERLKTQGYTIAHTEGYRQGDWILLDAGEVIIHIFVEAQRTYYDLESLWSCLLYTSPSPRDRG